MAQQIIWAIVILGCLGVLLVLLPVFGIAVPPYIEKIFWIVVAVCIGVLAIKFMVKQASSPP